MADPTTGTTDDTTGTTEQVGGNDAAAGGNDTDAKAKLAELERQKGQWLAEKSNYERTKQELEALRQQAHAAQSTPSPGLDVGRVAAETQRLAAEGDPLAQALILAAREQAQREAYLRQQMELERVPEADRAEVLRYAQELGVNPLLALKALKGDRYDKEASKLAEERRKLEEAQRRREHDALDVTARSVSSGEMKTRTMTLDEYTAKLRTLPPAEARELKRKADSGTIIVKME